MTKLTFAFLGLGVLAMAGCTTHETKVVRAEPTIVKETTVIEKTNPPVVVEKRVPMSTTTTTTETVVTDPHRTWWELHYAGQPYDRDRAIALHRVWCAEHPNDGGCTG